MTQRSKGPVGQLKIGPPVAFGGMGVIHQATDEAGQVFAVKFLIPTYAMRPQILARFKAAASVQSSLDHPNIVPVYQLHKDTAHGEGVVMKWVSGIPLDEEMESGHPPPWNFFETMAVMDPILDAVADAHQSGIVHRDLKPANVLLETSSGQGWPGTPCLIDFDLVKLTGKEMQNVTRDGTKMGTPPFMAPEQYMAAKNIDERADVYALGIMFRQMLTGIFPVNPNNQVALTRVYSGERPIESIAEHAPTLPLEIVRILDAAISISPAGRPPNAGALLNALREAIGKPKRAQSVVSIAPDQDTPDPAHHGDPYGYSSDLEYHGASASGGKWVFIIFGFIAFAMYLASANAN